MQDSEPARAGRVQNPFSGAESGPEWVAAESAAAGTTAYVRRLPRRWWLHVLLFVLTFLTTTIFGSALFQAFSTSRPLDERVIAEAYERLFNRDSALWAGCFYSIPLLTILMSHEMGHYLTCRRWGVDATLPYFGPSPTLLGTFGAFIWIRSPVYNRRSLFDIGVSGPIAGFVVLLPFLIAGVWLSRFTPGIHAQGPFAFGTPLALRAFEWLRFPAARANDISLHPLCMAAWAGLLATAINLLPIGQLDGGHIVYAVCGERGHRVISLIVVAVLAVCGFFYWPWWIWAVAMFFFRRHPLIYDQEPLGKKRTAIACTALALFIVSISVIPVQVR